ncbi:MAG: LytTR family transcriptional regulator [Mogibacterium sp.]|nr:LytTR family transcriptional regulator [Mogibacterium sp.]
MGISHYKTNRDLPEYISVISASQCARVKIADIECIEQEGRKLHIITPARDYTVYESINTIARSLVDRAFYRAMKGLILNFDQVKDITGNYINFYSGQSVTMGKNSVSKTRQAYRRYLLKYPPYSLWEPPTRVPEIRKRGMNYDHSWQVAEDEGEYLVSETDTKNPA